MTSIDDVQDLSPRDQYTASAAQTAFDYTFPIFTQADLTIYVDDVLQVLTTDYTVAGAGEETGGTVTFVNPMTGGEVVTIYRDIAIARNTDVQQNGPWSSTSYNDEMDKVFLIMQELENKIGRAIRFPLTAAISNTQTLLDPISTYAGKFLRITSAGLLEAATALDNTVALSAQIIGELLNPRTAAEITAGVTIVDYSKPELHPYRYQENEIPGTTDLATGVSASLSVLSASGGGVLTLPSGMDTIALTSVTLPIGCSIDCNGATIVPLSTPDQIFLIASGSGDRRDGVSVKNLKVAGDCTYVVRLTGSYWRNFTAENILVIDGDGTAIVKTEITGAANPDHLMIRNVQATATGVSWKYGWWGTSASNTNSISSAEVSHVYIWAAAAGWPVRVEHALTSFHITGLYHGAGSGIGGGVLYIYSGRRGRVGRLWSEASNGDVSVVGGAYREVNFDLIVAQTNTATESAVTKVINAQMFNCQINEVGFQDDAGTGYERDNIPPANYKTLVFVNDDAGHISRDVRIVNTKGNLNYGHITNATGQGIRFINKPGGDLIYANHAETAYTSATSGITSTPGYQFLEFSNWEWGYDEEAIEILISGEWIGTNAKEFIFYIEDATHELFRLDETGAGPFECRAIVKPHNDGSNRLWISGYSIHQGVFDQRSNNQGNTWARSDTRTSLLYAFASTMNAADSIEIHSIVIRQLRSTVRAA